MLLVIQISYIPTHMHDAMHAVYCMHVRSNMLCCPTFVDLTPKFGVHKYIYIHIQTQLKLNVLTFWDKISVYKNNEDKESK